MALKTCVSLLLFLTLTTNFTINHQSQIVEDTPQTDVVVFVTIRGIYPDEKLASNDKLYLRGSGCYLNWTAGVPLNHNAANTWTLLLPC